MVACRSHLDGCSKQFRFDCVRLITVQVIYIFTYLFFVAGSGTEEETMRCRDSVYCRSCSYRRCRFVSEVFMMPLL